MSHHAEGTIAVQTYEPKPYEQPEGAPSLNEIHVTETFSGAIEGVGRVRFLQALRADGSASFVGIERVEGTLAGRKGTFLFQDEGTLTGDRVEGRWFVIPGSATGGLVGLRGEGTFAAKLGEHAKYTLEYRFE